MKVFKNIAIAVIASLILFSCSVGVKKDLMTGLNVKYDGFTVEGSYLVKDNKQTSEVTVKPGQDVSMVFTGITGFKAVDGKVFPGASIFVTDTKGKTILEIADLFSQYDSTGVDPKMVQEALSIKFTAPSVGIEKGEIYDWKSKVWDKKGKSTLTSEIKLNAEF